MRSPVSFTTLTVALALFCLTTTVLADKCKTGNYAIKWEGDIVYTHDNTTYQGYLVVPNAPGMRPGMVLFHQFLGLGSFEKSEARRFASLGYITLAADIYGKGVRFVATNATSIQNGFAAAGRVLSDRLALRSLALKAVQYLRSRPNVDTRRVATAGYCLGGTVAVELARSGTTNIQAFISYHGDIGPVPNTPNAENLAQQKLLVLHGRDDPLVPPAAVANFTAEFTAADSDVQFISFSQTVHAFTFPDVDTVIRTFPGLAGAAKYSPRSTARAREYTNDFLNELFGCVNGELSTGGSGNNNRSSSSSSSDDNNSNKNDDNNNNNHGGSNDWSS